jgi:hypothetical protein
MLQSGCFETGTRTSDLQLLTAAAQECLREMQSKQESVQLSVPLVPETLPQAASYKDIFNSPPLRL